MKYIVRFFFAFLFLVPMRSYAWGLLGHRVVGEIAEGFLTPKARVAVKAILGDSSMAMSANWPDFIKSDPSYNYLGVWHYVDFDEPMNNEQIRAYLQHDTAMDAYTRIIFLSQQLKNKALPREQKLLYLRMLIHIVGDIHQPFHAARASDLGGNRVQVQWFGQPSNIHKVWDEQLIDYQQLSYTEYVRAINHSSAAQRSTWQKASVADWVIESHDISNELYADINASDKKLSYKYNFQHIATANQQLLKAGVRLAGLLNQIFQ